MRPRARGARGQREPSARELLLQATRVLEDGLRQLVLGVGEALRGYRNGKSWQIQSIYLYPFK